MGRIVHAWVAVKDEVLIFCYQNTCHSWKWASGFHRHLNVKFLPLHLLITRKNIYPLNFLPVFSFTYCFSPLTQVTLDLSLLASPKHLHVATNRFYLLAFSTQHRHACITLLMTNPKNWAKLQRISSTVLLVMRVEIQASGNTGSLLLVQWRAVPLTSFWILQLFWGKNPLNINHKNTKAPWGQRQQRSRGRVGIGGGEEGSQKSGVRFVPV